MVDPVDVLKIYCQKFNIGRKLDLVSESEALDGDTTSIFVSRFDVLKSGFEELLEPTMNVRLPLDVTFYGEEAADVGGPRKEFFSLLMKEMVKEEWRLFKKEGELYSLTDDNTNLERKWYYAAGLTCGMLKTYF